ncbi:MAG: D-alanine--D-alanine ligase, partial [Faecousia sp.]
MMHNLLIMFGGQSSEHTISCSSAASLIPYIDRRAISLSVVGITREGKWYLTEASLEDIASGAWENDPRNLPAFLSPNRAMSGLQVIRGGAVESLPIDCVFPVMHGELCE